MKFSSLLICLVIYMNSETVSSNEYPTSCHEAAASFRSRIQIPYDGEYLLDLSPYYPAMPSPILRPVYCVDMNTCSPKEYITLPAGPEQNFAYTYPHRSNPSASDGCGNPYFRSGQTNFNKIRITLQSPIGVIRHDRRFSKSSGLRTQTYATAGDCYDYGRQGTAKGQFKVDITNTGFVINSSVTWIPIRHVAEIVSFNMDANRQVVSAFCGGHSGGCAPSGSLTLAIDGGWTLGQYHNLTNQTPIDPIIDPTMKSKSQRSSLFKKNTAFDSNYGQWYWNRTLAYKGQCLMLCMDDPRCLQLTHDTQTQQCYLYDTDESQSQAKWKLIQC